MPRRVLALQHMDEDNPGRFGDFLAADGFTIDTVMLHSGEQIPSFRAYDLMLVLGGAMDVWEEERLPWLAAEKQAIAEWVGKRSKPYLGICLGHQLLASALGGKVGLARAKEVGAHEVVLTPRPTPHPLVQGLAGRTAVAQWHHAEVQQLPAEAACLAGSATTAIQIMAIGDVALGIQFHAEWKADFIDHWARIPSYMAALEREVGPGAYPRIRSELAAIMPGFAGVGRTLYDNLMKRSGLKKAA